MATPSRRSDFRSARRYPRPLRLPTFRGLTAGQPFSAIWPVGWTYHSFHLRFTIAGAAATAAQIRAQVSKIRLIVDGDAKIDASATELQYLHQFWNRARDGADNIVDGTLRIDVARPSDQEIDAQDGPAWGLDANEIDNFTAEITLAGGATIDAIDSFARVTAATPLGRHYCLRRLTENQAALGDKVVQDWNMRADYGVYAIHVNKAWKPDGGNIVSVGLQVDQTDEISPYTPAGVIQSLYRAHGLTQQSGFAHIPFAQRGRPMEALPMIAQDMRLTLTTDGALGNFDLLLEQLEGVDPEPKAA